MATGEIERVLLGDGDVESGDMSHVHVKVSPANDAAGYYVSLPESDGAGQAFGAEPAGDIPSRRSRSTLLMLGLTCLATVVYLTAACVSFLPSHVEVETRRDAPNDAFYLASHTGFHFQPAKNWMNDPNGPMYYMGYYHFFYQYNPDGVVWGGNISWGHAVSTDLMHWMYLDLALTPDQWYDNEGVWSGSATILPDGTPALLYTGSRDGMQQSQSLAIPEDPSDALLRKWKKVTENPIILNPDDISPFDFRDPTTAWMEPDGFWRIVIGAVKGRKGIAMLYKSKDFRHWEMEEQYLHSVEGTGMWECVDFFPVSVEGKAGLNHSVLRDTGRRKESFKYVLKVSLDTTRHDHYALGTYSTETHTFEVDNPALDAGIGWRYDYGKYYASKTFYDQEKRRRVLWGWVNESDSEADDIKKGWASVQAIPRTVWLDPKVGSNLLLWPVVELDTLRGAKVSREDVTLEGGQILRVAGADGPQWDIEVTFDFPDVKSMDFAEVIEDELYDCSQGGSAHRGLSGPFGLLVHSDEALTEQTAIFFYITPGQDGQWKTRVCSDQSRSSLAAGVDTTVYGSFVTVLPTEDTLSMRVIIDHSIIETFVQGGRLCITSRVYPTNAINDNARLFLFNNGTSSIKVRNLNAWQMSSINMITI